MWSRVVQNAQREWRGEERMERRERREREREVQLMYKCVSADHITNTLSHTFSLCPYGYIKIQDAYNCVESTSDSFEEVKKKKLFNVSIHSLSRAYTRTHHTFGSYFVSSFRAYSHTQNYFFSFRFCIDWYTNYFSKFVYWHWDIARKRVSVVYVYVCAVAKVFHNTCECKAVT